MTCFPPTARRCLPVKALLRKYRSLLLYGLFGVLTTLVNLLSFRAAEVWLHLPTVPATCLAWVLSVAFAYVTNRRWVFESREHSLRGILREIGSFTACRLMSGLMDVGIMYVCVDLLKLNSLLIKLLSNVLVVIVNYIASKLLVFRR